MSDNLRRLRQSAVVERIPPIRPSRVSKEGLRTALCCRDSSYPFRNPALVGEWRAANWTSYRMGTRHQSDIRMAGIPSSEYEAYVRDLVLRQDQRSRCA